MKLLFKTTFLFSLLISILSFANAKGKSASQEKPDKLQHSFPNEMKEKEEWKARGVIIKFHRWPNAKQQKEIIRRLKASGLKKTKSIRSFQTQLFEWSEGGLKPSLFGEGVCKKVENLPIVKRCNPDHLLPLNHQSNKVFSNETKLYRIFNDSSLSFLLSEATQNTEAGFIEHCTSCKKQNSISFIPLNIRTCNLLSHKNKLKDGTLSDYWAQELIGADLLREELKNTPPPERSNWIAVLDSQVRDHNILVKNLISDEGPHGVLPELRNGKVSVFQTSKDEEYQNTLSLFSTGFPGDYVSTVHHFEESSPHFINNSMEWRNSEDIYETFQKLSPPSIIVTASGNEFPFSKLDNTKSKASKNFDVIIVGSFSPHGFASHFSVSGEEVHIMAPSDQWITSSGKNGEYKKFGGTSGAAPLVTGSLAGFEWLSGYHPTSKEAKILLKKTAIPTLDSHEEPQINGVGLVNAYKLGEVGKRLKEKCKKNISCFEKEILNEENYNFDSDKWNRHLKRDLSKAFPGCVAGKNLIDPSKVSSCEEKKEVFKRLRKAILLNPEESKEFLEHLSCIYREGGFTQNVEALNKLALALGPKEEVRTSIKALAEKEKPISDEVLRLMLGMGGFEETLKHFENKIAIRIAGGVGETALPLVEKAFETNNPDLQKEAVEAAGLIGESALPLIKRAFKTGNPDLQEEVWKAAGQIGESALPLVEKLFEASNPNLQWQALVYVANKIGKPALPLLERAFETGNLDLQVGAVHEAGLIGESALPSLKRMLESENLKPNIEKTIETWIKRLE